MTEKSGGDQPSEDFFGKDSKATDIHLHEKSLVSRLNLAKITKPVGTLLKASKALLNSVSKDL